MHIYLKNNRAKFHPDPTWNDGASPKRDEQEQEHEQQDGERYALRSFLI